MSGRPDGAAGGAAHELPAGRLRGFEDDDAAPDLATLLSRRAPSGAAQPSTAGASFQQPAAPDGEVAGPAAASTSAGSTAAPRPGRPAKKPKKPPQEQRDRAPEHARGNKIRSSSVHIPAALLDRVIAERERSSRSNGEVIIAAIEQTHSQLPDLIERRDSTGGGLFATRSSRGARLSDGPLTPLNVRLFEADYQVIDDLVARFGAYSRGHLISTALTAYFDVPQQPSTRDR